MTKKNVFSAAKILLPDFSPKSEEFSRWSVIACDQFTSDSSYWDACEKIIDGRPSTYDYILPEAFLNTKREEEKSLLIKRCMANVEKAGFSSISGFVYVERELSTGNVRQGVVGKIDLEAYDYSPDSESAVRASEMTVADRLPPRAKIRSEATIELPHVLVFAAPGSGVIEEAKAEAENGRLIYDFELMQGGGHIKGFALEGRAAENVENAAAKYEASTALPYAVGDGNHSLAAAKLHYENIKKQLGDGALSHPARYALCEVVSLGDQAIEFEPIYRVVTGLDSVYDDFISEISSITEIGRDGDEERIKIITSDIEKELAFTCPTHALIVGTLQDFIDKFLSKHHEVSCDYIHGREEAEEIGRRPGCAAFIFNGIAKEDLLPYVEKNGVLPRKTFSMGEARDKRYYLEARKIVL